MMTYTTWKDETSRGILTPRSSLLKTLDRALEVYSGNGGKTLANKKAVFTALKSWINAKDEGGDWKSSTRNSKVVNGKGTVERLLNDFVADPVFAGEARQLLNVAAPVLSKVNAPYVAGKIDQMQDKDGKFHEFIRQKKGNSCVPSTIVMMKTAYHPDAKGKLSEDQIRGLIVLAKTGNTNAGISSVSNAAQQYQNWQNEGTTPDYALKVLQMNPYKIPGARLLNVASASTLDELRKCTSKKPGLVGWMWQGGGGHFTLCCGPTKDGAELMFIDPWVGIGYVPNTATAFRKYQPESTVGNLTAAIVGQ